MLAGIQWELPRKGHSLRESPSGVPQSPGEMLVLEGAVWGKSIHQSKHS